MDGKGKGREEQHGSGSEHTGHTGATLELLREKLIHGETVWVSYHYPQGIRLFMLGAALHSFNRVAWCPSTGLVAVPVASSDPVIGILLSYASKDGTSFTLELPPRAVPCSSSHEYISYVSFSPGGELLLVVTSSVNDPILPFVGTSALQPEQAASASIRLVLYQATEYLNRWTCILDWDSARARPVGPEVTKVVHLRWFGTQRAAANSVHKHRDGGKKRKRDVLGELGGQSFLAVLDTQEVRFTQYA